MVKFNLRLFIEEFAFARESGDLDSEQELLDSFKRFIDSASPQIKNSCKQYISKNVLAREYPDLQDIMANY